MIKDQITDKIKEAMKAKDSVSLQTLRSLKTALTNAESEKNAKEMDEAKGLQIIQKQIKQRKDSAAIFVEQKRDDLASTELAQAVILEGLLPEQMSAEEVEVVVNETIEETGASTMKDMGKVMGMVSKKLAGKIDNKTISDIVRGKLS